MITTDIYFPEQLPAPLLEGNTFRPVQTFSRTPMESGRARQRLKFGSVPSMNQFVWIMKDDEGVIFEAWYKSAINNGTAWFNIHRATPLGFISLVCRFAEMYVGPERVGRDRWKYNATLEIWEQPAVPPDWWEILPDFLLNPEIFDLAMNREWPEA